MRDIPESWRPYARLQASTSRNRRVDVQGWGLEAGLEYLLDVQASNPSTSKKTLSIERAIANGRARERYRHRLRARFLTEAATVDPAPILDHRQQLRKLFLGLNDTERQILSATAMGYDSEEISNILAVKPATVRKRIDRLRSRLAA